MDFRIRRTQAELDSTGYMEIGPGRYSGKHWQDGFLFVWEDAFGMAEGILARHFPSYDHFSMNDVPREIGRAVTAEWRDVASRLSAMTAVEAHAALHLDESYHQHLDDVLDAHTSEIATMLRELADLCDGFYEQADWVCILGM